VTKKGPGRDHRSEPDSEGGDRNFRVDRVFAPARQTRQNVSPPAAARPTATKPPTIPPPVGTSPPQTTSAIDSETELALRRQMSRLQRQLADAQRELANKDDEVAAAVEKRLELQAAYEVIAEEQRQTRLLVDEAIADRSRAAGVAQRLQEATTQVDELTHQLERERTERGALGVQLDELQAAFEKARTMWRDESATVDDQHIAQIAQLEQQKKAAVDAAEAAMRTSTERQYQAHEAELEALKAAHERALSALRGELEPKARAARDHQVEIERLNSLLQAQATEHQNLLAERIELDKWELQQQADAHAAELAQLQRQHTTELARLAEEVVAANQAGQLIERNAKLREELWEQTVGTLRASQKELQQELAEARERAAQAEASKWSVETRLVGTLQANEKTNEKLRELGEKLAAAEDELRRTSQDRERFAAYLQEGLAMLGALPPSDPDTHETASEHTIADDDAVGEAAESNVVGEAAESDVVTAEAQPFDEGSRPTRSYATIDDEDLEPEIERTPIPDEETNADPLPEPTRN
jgi:chromosome segregation ATPase